MFAEDEHLISFSSMGWEFGDLPEKLAACNVDHTFGDELEGVPDCDWLVVLDGGLGVKTCWLRGTAPVPIG